MERGDGGKMTGNERRTMRETGASAVERDTFNHPPYHGNKLKRLQRVLNVYKTLPIFMHIQRITRTLVAFLGEDERTQEGGRLGGVEVIEDAVEDELRDDLSV